MRSLTIEAAYYYWCVAGRLADRDEVADWAHCWIDQGLAGDCLVELSLSRNRDVNDVMELLTGMAGDLSAEPAMRLVACRIRQSIGAGEPVAWAVVKLHDLARGRNVADEMTEFAEWAYEEMDLADAGVTSHRDAQDKVVRRLEELCFGVVLPVHDP
jgi:hypothetical protein